ncbi:MAG TPA: hypothetical protein VG797_06355 [Phycisphaerales bacterium]|nr:hypothetical protein [Phycisphaerales bacterium]
MGNAERTDGANRAPQSIRKLQMMLSGGWAWWIGASIGVAAGLWLLWSGFFSDPGRGRRRCRGCWYDMSATPAARDAASGEEDAREQHGWKCPECGRVTTRERDLLRARRRWSRIVGGVLALLIAAGLIGAERVVRYGWVRAAPTWSLIVALARIDDPAIETELQKRVRVGTLGDRQTEWLMNRCAAIVEQASGVPSMRIAMRTMSIIGDTACLPCRRDRTPPPRIPGGTRAVRALAQALDHSDQQVRSSAARSIGECGEDGCTAAPVLLATLDNTDLKLTEGARVGLTRLCGPRGTLPVSDLALAVLGLSADAALGLSGDTPPEEWTEFTKAMRDARFDRGRALPPLREALLSDRPQIRVAATLALVVMRDDDPLTRDRLFAALEPRPWWISQYVVDALILLLAQGPHDDRLARAVEQNLSRFWSKTTVFTVVSQWDKGAERFLPIMKDVLAPNALLLTDSHFTERIETYLSAGGDREFAIACTAVALRRAIESFRDHSPSMLGPFRVWRIVGDAKRLDIMGNSFRSSIEEMRKDADESLQLIPRFFDVVSESNADRATRLLLDARRFEKASQERRSPSYRGVGLAAYVVNDLKEENRLSCDVLLNALREGRDDANLICEALRSLGARAEPALPDLKHLETSSNDTELIGRVRATIVSIEDAVRLGERPSPATVRR